MTWVTRPHAPLRHVGVLATSAIVWLHPAPRVPDIRPVPEWRPRVIDKHKAQRLLGETMRDIGILVFVFAPLDAFFQRERPGWLPLALVIGCGLLFIALGIMLEAKE